MKGASIDTIERDATETAEEAAPASDPPASAAPVEERVEPAAAIGDAAAAPVDEPESPPPAVALETALAAAPAPVETAAASVGPEKVLRFRTSERIIHWAIAIPFMVCWSTAVVLVTVYNPDPHRPLRFLFAWTHRLSGVCLIVLPLLAVTLKRDARTHLYNIRQAWIWSLGDVKWLFLMGLAAVSKKVKLPEQGKFNAGEKLNFMIVMATHPLYILTGLTIWATGGAFLAWLVHFFMAVMATPFLLGHIYMATLNPSSRAAFQGMMTGFVDRQWAKHHHRRWYEEHVEPAG